MSTNLVVFRSPKERTHDLQVDLLHERALRAGRDHDVAGESVLTRRAVVVIIRVHARLCWLVVLIVHHLGDNAERRR